ncbi:MAG TPA: hypothetical protein P5295_18870 [Spirochaetota bacterium]|nr:hypothetical protein [Spirochaetota bacterium]
MKYILAIIPVLVITFISCSDSSDRTSRYVSTVATVGGNPDGVTVAGSGNIYITDILNGDIKQINQEGTVTTLSLDGDSPSHPDGITAVTENFKDILYVADTGSNDPDSTDGSIIKIEVDLTADPSTADAGSSTFVDSAVLENPTGIALDADGNLYVADQSSGDIYKIPLDPDTHLPETPVSLTDVSSSGDIDEPHGLSLVTNEDNSVTIYTTDQGSDSNNIVTIDIPSSGNTTEAEVTELTPESDGGNVTDSITNSTFNKPHGVAIGSNGAIFICDENNNRVQIITPGGNVVTFAGSGIEGDTDGETGSVQFSKPRGIGIDKNGDILVCDYGNGKVKKIER